MVEDGDGLADAVDNLEQSSAALVSAGDTVVDSAIEWVDETLSLVREQDTTTDAVASTRRALAGAPGTSSSGSVWRDLGA